MKTTLNHIGINLSDTEKCFPFWQELLAYLEFTITPDGNHFDASDGHTFLCFSTTKVDYLSPPFHRRRTGLNHIAFGVSSKKEVDIFVAEFLKKRRIPILYGSARKYNYTKGYYAVYFEDPDRIKVEVAYTGQ